MYTIALIIDEERNVRRAVRKVLMADFERVLETSSASEGVDLAAAHRPELVVVDLALPDHSGQWVCAELRKWSTASIIVLSAHHAEADKVRLLEGGADDFVTKPFNPAELRARVGAQLRRAKMAQGPGDRGPVRIGNLTVDTAARTVARDGDEIHLTPTEWDLLRVFVRHAGRTLTHAQLFSAVWATSGRDPRQHLRVYVANLRRKLEPDAVRPTLITTVPGVGYRLVAVDQE